MASPSKMRIVPPLKSHPLHQLWMTRGVGGSAAASILGLNPYQSAQALWEYLTHRVDKPAPSEAMLRGIEEESTIRAFYCRRFDVEGCSLQVIDSEHDFIRAQIDFMDEDFNRPAEFKSTRSKAALDAMKRKEIPSFWRPQLTHQCMILGKTEVDVFVYDGNEYYYALFTVDPASCVKLRKREVEFWQRYVLTDTPPSDNKLKLVIG